ncbi:MAG: tetratricopeptide repeat protein [Bacteroidaceae bacterium]|nr:tetratricopeptide repeat protein [Bacteroidaceae bacterium]
MRTELHRTLIAVLISALMPAFANAKAPKWFKSARKAMFEIVAYDDDGRETARSHGFFTDSDGTGITGLSVLSGAAKAVTIDGQGITRPVEIILGADDTYDVVRFRVRTDKKFTALTPAAHGAAKDDKVYILPSGSDPMETSVKEIKAIAGDHRYYTLQTPWDIALLECPVMDSEGRVTGIVQRGSEGDTLLYALESAYVTDIAIAALDRETEAYQSLRIKTALPAEEDQALAYIMMSRGVKSMIECRQLHEQFLEQFPGSPDGMFAMGTFLILEVDSTQYADGLAMIDKAIAAAADEKDRFHCDYANIILNALSRNIQHPSEWTYDKALHEIDAAIAIKPEPVYHQVRGNILYSMERYQEAYDSFVKVNNSDMASADTYLTSYYVSRNMAGSPELGIALLDSVLMKLGTPIPPRAAQVLLERALLKEEAGLNRDAVMDYNSYEQLAGSYNMNSTFYLNRHKVEIKARMYEQALQDIEKARSLSPRDSSLVLEHASLLLRIGQNDDALPLLEELSRAYPDVQDVQRLLGVCYMRREDKVKARRHLTIAKELGDELAAQLLEQL